MSGKIVSLLSKQWKILFQPKRIWNIRKNATSMEFGVKV